MKTITVLHTNKGWYAVHKGNRITDYYGSREGLMNMLNSHFESLTPINQ